MKNLINCLFNLLLIFGLVAVERTDCLAADPAVTPSDRMIKDQIVISIRPSLQTDSRVIRLVDVANITGGDAALRERLKQLDIEDSLAPGESVTIQPSQIEFRLRIAGIDLDRVAIRGAAIRVTAREAGPVRQMNPDKLAALMTAPSAGGTKSQRSVDFSSISFDEGPLEREIIQAARECVLSKLPWPAENVECRLLQQLSPELRQVNSASEFEISAELRSPGPPVGRVQVRVIAEAPRVLPIEVFVQLEIRHVDQVVLAARTIERGHVITASDLYVDRQDVTELQEYCSKIEDLVGMSARRTVRALLPLRISDVETKVRNDTQVVIKRKEQVKMTARLGNLTVTAMGEALQEGRVGETIRLRNLESNANLQGRVTGPGEAEITF